MIELIGRAKTEARKAIGRKARWPGEPRNRPIGVGVRIAPEVNALAVERKMAAANAKLAKAKPLAPRVEPLPVLVTQLNAQLIQVGVLHVPNLRGRIKQFGRCGLPCAGGQIEGANR